jgi:cell division protease FtsH
VESFSRPFFVALLLGFAALGLLAWLGSTVQPGEMERLAYSDFIVRVDKNEVKSATIDRQTVHGEFTNRKHFVTTAPEGADLAARLIEHRAKVDVVPDGSGSFLVHLLSWLPFLLIIGVWLYFMRGAGGGAGGGAGRGGAFGFGKSRARLMTPDQGHRVTFNDVAGIDEAASELEEIVEFLKSPEKFQRLGGKIPKGCLLVGPPGTGKTLLARAIAGEANVPFFSISGSDFVEMFVGVGASRVRDMFEQAKQNAPCIIFVDEIDAVGRKRGMGFSGTNDEREQTLNQLLVEMDGFDTKEGVILLAATNRPDVLDPALLRPGRFDRQIVLSNPDIIGREKILAVHMRKVPVAPDVDVNVIARGTPGFSGADLANLVNEAALLAARREKRMVGMVEFEDAKDKVMMGSERRSMVMTEKERRTTATHEAGHALVTLFSPGHDPLHKVTIIPRGRALGLTLALPERDRYGFSRTELDAKVAIMFGGRVAEELSFGKEAVTTGAANDLKQATELARRMVTEFGFSDKVGPLHYGEDEQSSVYGSLLAPQRPLSEETARLIDEEVRRIIEEAEARARGILSQRGTELKILSDALLVHETLSGEDVEKVLRGEEVSSSRLPARALSLTPNAGSTDGEGTFPHAPAAPA